ncbi:fas1 domain-containing protein [Fusarium heterosporum]|uniref:Fas1 domain-containing protein n=1 Tax=Fusarium heterosporum TaxID=42747 RepID=A0A8H5WI39_FUSHE|nr:fas1 domain-containing protein [Fusarium heterosporum]
MKPLTFLTALFSLTFASQEPLRENQQVPLDKSNFPPLHGHLPIMSSDRPSVQPSVALADILGSNRGLTSFSSFARMQPSTDDRLSDLSTNTTVLAPLNSAVDALPRKPWEQPADYDAFGANAYDGDGGQDRARENMRRFVVAHLVPSSPWDKDEKIKTLGGKEIWWVEKEGRRVVMPDEVEVERVASQVGNGELWILKGVLNYA